MFKVYESKVYESKVHKSKVHESKVNNTYIVAATANAAMEMMSPNMKIL